MHLSYFHGVGMKRVTPRGRRTQESERKPKQECTAKFASYSRSQATPVQGVCGTNIAHHPGEHVQRSSTITISSARGGEGWAGGTMRRLRSGQASSAKAETL